MHQRPSKRSACSHEKTECQLEDLRVVWYFQFVALVFLLTVRAVSCLVVWRVDLACPILRLTVDRKLHRV